MRERSLVTLVLLVLAAAACAEPRVGGTGDERAMPTSSAQSEGAQSEDDTPIDESHTTTSSTAGADEDSPQPPERENTGSVTSSERPFNEPERVPDDTTPLAVRGETPADLLAMIIADAAGRAGVTAAAVTVIRDEFVIWNDGSLGCAEPGQMYTQALVEGYWVVLEAAGVEYDYRATTRGYWFLCEGAGLQPRPRSG